MDIFLGESTFAWASASATRWCEPGIVETRLESLFEAAAKDWPRRLVPRPWRGARLWLSGAVARPFLVQMPQGLRNRQDRLAVAHARAAELTGQPGPLVLQLEPGQHRSGAELAVTAEATWLAQIENAARAAQLPIQSMRPWWAGALDMALSENPEVEFFSARDSESVVMLLANGTGWISADSYVPLPQANDEQALVRRRLLVAGIAPANSWITSMDTSTAFGVSSLWPASRRTLVESLQ